MRLVRVTTQNPQSRFDGTLSADLDIAPGSKIALKSLSLEQKDNVISVDVNTDTVSYTQGATTYTAQLDHDDYTVNTYPTLLLDMETKLNATAAYIPGTGNTRIQGMEYRVGVDDDHKFQLQARKGDVGEQPNNWDLEEDIVYDTNPLNETNQYAVDAVVPDGNCQTMKVNARMPNGNGYLRGHQRTDTDRTLCVRVRPLVHHHILRVGCGSSASQHGRLPVLED
jgi:hypothetical protein